MNGSAKAHTTGMTKQISISMMTTIKSIIRLPAGPGGC
jgi:hypothetical protein